MECTNSSKSRKSCDSISILVVDDDTTCLSFVAALLKKFKYEVVTAKHPNDALCALRIKDGGFDLVMSDVHMPDMNGFQLQQLITHEFNLPVVLMSVDSKEGVVSKGMESGAAFFISKPVSPNDLKNLWQFAAIRNNKIRKEILIEQGKNEYSQNRPVQASNSRGENNKENSKRKVAAASKEGSQPECDVNAKKPKVVWTNGLHYRFLEAIRSIGLERSVPKKILQVMNVPGLTRENVASHLQKYRMFLKRVSDASYQVEVGDDGRNYSSALALISRLNKPQFFGANSYQNEYHSSFHNSHASVVASTNIIDPTIIPQVENSPQIISALMPFATHSGSSCVNFQSYKLQNNIDHGDSCYVPNTQNELLADFNGDYQHQASNLALIQDLQNGGINIVDDSSSFCSAFDITATQQRLNNPTHHLHNNPSAQPNMNILTQPQQQGCEYTESSLLYDGMMNSSSVDQAVYHQGRGSMDYVKLGSASSQTIEECSEEDALESLLAFGPFGEDQIQTLEGI